MDLKNILDKEIYDDNISAEVKDKEDIYNEKEGMIRTHKKPIQLRDIENRSLNTKREPSFDTEEEIQGFLIEEKKNSLRKPWNKLDNGMKINRLKVFCDKQKIKHKLSENEKESLSKLLIVTCHSNKINRNTDVNYNTDTCEIETIKPLEFDEAKRKYKMNLITTGNRKNDKPKSKSQIDRFLKKSNKKK